MHPARLPIEDLITNCEIRRQRRSGPGGQHRNKVETGIFVEHKPTGIRAEATEQRSQPKNQELALFRIRVNLALQHRSELVDSPSELWKSRLRGGKIFVNAEHADFPSLLAECLDMLDANNWDTKAAAGELGCSTSQLVRFLKKDGRGLAELNGTMPECWKDFAWVMKFNLSATPEIHKIIKRVYTTASSKTLKIRKW